MLTVISVSSTTQHSEPSKYIHIKNDNIYIYIFIYVCVCMYIYVYICSVLYQCYQLMSFLTYTSLNMCTCIYVLMTLHTYIHTYTYAHILTDISMSSHDSEPSKYERKYAISDRRTCFGHL